MHGQRMTWPCGADFAGGVVADGDDKIDPRCVGDRKFIPALRTEQCDVVAERLQHLERHGVYFTARKAARRESAEAFAAEAVQDRLGQDRARRVGGA